VALLYILRLCGDADEVAARVAAVSDEAWRVMQEHGFVGETLGRMDDGIVIAEVWESADGHRAGLGHPVVVAEFERVEMPPVEIEGPYDVVRDFQPGR